MRLPHLYHVHRGYFLVVCSVITIHFVAALDDLLPHAAERHAATVYKIANSLASYKAWGYAHALIIVIALLGLYPPWRVSGLLLLRLSSAASISMFLALGGSFAVADVEYWPHASILGIGTSAFVVLSSLAAMLEPGTNPASMRPDDGG